MIAPGTQLKLRTQCVLCLTFIACFVFCLSDISLLPVMAQDKKASPGPSRKLYGSINAFGSACVSSGIIPLSTQLPTSVEDVKLGSPAYYAGVTTGDRILTATIENNHLSMKIERNGHIYFVKMRAKTDLSQTNLRTGTITFSLGESLRGYRIKLIVDHSGSMSRILGQSDKQRWEWVVEQLNRFCSESERQAGSTFDLCLFNEDVDERQGLSAKKVADVLAQAVTTGNTNLAAALKATLDKGGSAEKPLLVLLITDGQALSSKENADILVTAFSRSPAARRSKFIYLQAGYSEEGVQFMSKLEHALAAQGMGQCASMLLFEEASDKGVLGAVEQSLQKK